MKAPGLSPAWMWIAFSLIAFLAACDGGEGPRPRSRDLHGESFEESRRNMVLAIRARGFEDERVLEAVGAVPRHRFLPRESAHEAYDLRSLPIGSGENISDPYLVAVMTGLLALKPGDRVLEIGTGSGYHAAVLARLAKQVYTVEIRPELADGARERLASLGCENVDVLCGNGWLGWPEHQPFDAIILTAAPPELPEELVRQLALGGRLLVPLGKWPANQDLTLVRKDLNGIVSRETVKPVRFGPLIKAE